MNERKLIENSKSYNTIYKIESTKDNSEDCNNKNETKELIEQTKKMMEEYSLNKMMKNNKVNNLYNDINNFEYANVKENHHLINKSYSSTNSLIQKLICKNKEIKVLERLLKEKTMQLKAAQEKLNAKNKEIKKIYENLDAEKCNNLKVENMKLNKKIYNLEKDKNEIMKNCEKNVNELRIKINDLNNELTNIKSRYKELENSNLSLAKENDNFRQLLDAKTNLSLILKEKNNLGNKCVENYKKEINDLKTDLSNIIVVLKALFSKETQIYGKRSVFLNKLNYFGENRNTINNLDKNRRNKFVSSSNNSDICNNNEDYTEGIY